MKLPKTRLAILAIGLALAAPVAAFLHYNLPRHLVVRVVGADVLRYDNKDTRHPSVQGGPSRDIYQIFTESLDERRKPFVLHNEDTGFHFPWYVKFNSADIQSEATSMAGERATPTTEQARRSLQPCCSMSQARSGRLCAGSTVFLR